MKSAHYSVTDRDSNSKHYLVVYDEDAPCVFCGLPVVLASVSATAICGWCDNGTPRIPEWQIRNRNRDRPRPTTAEVWGNKTQDFLFNTRDEFDAKMYELHLQGVEGFPHVIERLQREKDNPQ